MQLEKIGSPLPHSPQMRCGGGGVATPVYFCLPYLTLSFVSLVIDTVERYNFEALQNDLRENR